MLTSPFAIFLGNYVCASWHTGILSLFLAGFLHFPNISRKLARNGMQMSNVRWLKALSMRFKIYFKLRSTRGKFLTRYHFLNFTSSILENRNIATKIFSHVKYICNEISILLILSITINYNTNFKISFDNNSPNNKKFLSFFKPAQDNHPPTRHLIPEIKTTIFSSCSQI